MGTSINGPQMRKSNICVLLSEIKNNDPLSKRDLVENKEVEKNSNDVPNNEPAIDSAENFDVDNTEAVENKEVEKNSNDVPNNEPR